MVVQINLEVIESMVETITVADVTLKVEEKTPQCYKCVHVSMDYSTPPVKIMERQENEKEVEILMSVDPEEKHEEIEAAPQTNIEEEKVNANRETAVEGIQEIEQNE